jgi:L-lactate utilization protein LutB
MYIDLPICILEPELREKRILTAKKLSHFGQEAIPSPKVLDIKEIKQELRRIREYSRININSLTAELQNTLSQKYPSIKVTAANTNIEAVKYITGISEGIKTVSINNSSAVVQDLKPALSASGFTLINSYLDEFDIHKKEIMDYWALPRMLDKDLLGTFEVVHKMPGIDISGAGETRKYMAVLGVNAISAEDGTVFFLQHFSNIYKDLNQAKKVVLVIGLDKIVKNSQDAGFQSKCMGIFGMESIVLGIHPKSKPTPSIADLNLPFDDKNREIHVIILDNGRKNLIGTEFEDLFLCIGCRACNKHCPIQNSFTDGGYIWTPRNYLSQFLDGKSHSIDTCLHCEACRMECPLDIDLPHLMWNAKSEYSKKHGTSFYHKIIGEPELLAKAGTAFAFLANPMMKTNLVRIPMEAITGIDRKTTLPVFHFNTFRKWINKNAT